jgi:cytochrome c oxidase subunit 4
MADHALPDAAHEAEEPGSHSAMYLKVWAALLVLTVLEYFYAKWMAGSMMSLIAGLMLLAGIKAALVAWYFMHVKFEGKWVYGLIIPASILAAVLIFGLIPDIALYESNPEAEEDPTAMTAPLYPSGPESYLLAPPRFDT